MNSLLQLAFLIDRTGRRRTAKVTLSNAKPQDVSGACADQPFFRDELQWFCTLAMLKFSLTSAERKNPDDVYPAL
jgi:hypothetical protein